MKEPDITVVFRRLQAASRDNHLPAFKRCEEGGMGRAPDVEAALLFDRNERVFYSNRLFCNMAADAAGDPAEARRSDLNARGMRRRDASEEGGWSR